MFTWLKANPLQNTLMTLSPTESLWRTLSNTTGIKDEQIILNVALTRMDISWKETTPLSKCCQLKAGWEGEGNDGIKVYVISQRLFCRSSCCVPKRWKEFYVVHPFGTHEFMDIKKKKLREMHAWFLD